MTGLIVLRLTLALIMFTHAVHRIKTGTVGDLGEFLNMSIFSPIGVPVAWSLTIYELLGSLLLAVGWLVRPLSVGFIAMLIVGIAMVHFPNWFVVGAGKNGMEYSVALIAGFLAVAFPNSSSKK